MRFLGAAIGLILLWAGPAGSETAGPSPAFVARTRALSEWIVANSSFDSVPDRPPIYVSLSDAELRRLVAGDAARAERLTRNFAIRAVYLKGVMYLRDDIEVGRDDQIVLHELVHHFQWTSERRYGCPGAREAEAYELQRKYAEAIGEAPRIPSPMTLIALTHCRAN